MKFFYLLISLIFISHSYADQLFCNFEEVYSNGDVQLGTLLLKDSKVRYEYLNDNLYTIIYKSPNYFIIHNHDKSIVQKLSQDNNIFSSMVKVLTEYPNIQESYIFDNLKIKIEKSSNNFIKRVAIQSNELNLSINLVNCSYLELDDKYFNHFNLIEYKIK